MLADLLVPHGHVLRALTLHEPHVHCIFGGPGKSVENRKWFPELGPQIDIMGPWVREQDPQTENWARFSAPRIPLWLAIHAGKKVDKPALAELQEIFGPIDTSLLREACIVGLARVSRVLDVESMGRQHPLRDHHAPWLSGPYGWELAEVTDLPILIEGVRGYQKLWRPRLEDQAEIYTQVRELLAAKGESTGGAS